MDVDAPNLLKRCSSAPLINEASSTVVTSPTTNSAPRNSFFSMFSNNTASRTRRYSGSFSPLTPPGNIGNCWGPRMAPRVSQLRLEECADVSNTREVAHEREVHSAMQMGQSCEDLTLTLGHVAGPAPANSPTRIPRFSPVVSPSPTRKYTTRRSLSPIAIRASSFSPVSLPAASTRAGGGACGGAGGKRRGDEADSPLSKRPCPERRTPSTPPTPDSDSLECTFRPVSPRPQPMNESPPATHSQDNHKSPS